MTSGLPCSRRAPLVALLLVWVWQGSLQAASPKPSSGPAIKVDHNRKLVCITHNDADGKGAEYAVRCWLKKEAAQGRTFSNTSFLRAGAGSTPLRLEKNSTVVICDMSFPRHVMERLHAATNGNLVLLDHHESARKDLQGLSYCHVDSSGKKSGAILAWEHFMGSPVPKLLQYVSDKDLYKFKLPRSKEINSFIRLELTGSSFPDWVNAQREFKKAKRGLPEEMVEKGKAIVAFEQAAIRDAVENSALVNLAGSQVRSVNATTCASEIGMELAKGHPFALTWVGGKKGNVRCSLRSDGGGANVSKIAKSLGRRFGTHGGGHVRAAGTTIPNPPQILNPDVSEQAVQAAAARIRGTPAFEMPRTEVGQNALIRYTEKLLGSAEHSSYPVMVSGKRAAATNTSLMADEVAKRLARTDRPGLAWAQLPNGKFLYVIADSKGAVRQEIHDAPPTPAL